MSILTYHDTKFKFFPFNILVDIGTSYVFKVYSLNLRTLVFQFSPSNQYTHCCFRNLSVLQFNFIID